MSCPTPEKVAHASASEAWAHARRLRKAKGAAVDLKPYKCRCGSFHVGHSQASLSFRIREARRKGIA